MASEIGLQMYINMFANEYKNWSPNVMVICGPLRDLVYFFKGNNDIEQCKQVFKHDFLLFIRYSANEWEYYAPFATAWQKNQD